MDFYEELGLTRTASTSQIRSAYKELAKILHPDHQKGERSRYLAQIQMARLNGMLQVLTNRSLRLRYDRTIETSPAPGRISDLDFLELLDSQPNKWYSRPAVTWAGAGIVALACLIGLAFLGHSGPRPYATAVDASFAGAIATNSSGAWPRPVPRPASKATSLGRSEAVRPLASSAASMAGDWSFAQPGTSSRAEGFYAPIFIWLSITEDHGKLHGQYSAKYSVPNRSLSPSVSFEFGGAAGLGIGKFAWYTPGGAKGVIRLQLLSSQALQVEWSADELGNDLDLIAGTALLRSRPRLAEPIEGDLTRQ